MSTSGDQKRESKTRTYRALAVLLVLAAVLAIMAFFPIGERIPAAAAPLEPPVPFDEPVVHHYK